MLQYPLHICLLVLASLKPSQYAEWRPIETDQNLVGDLSISKFQFYL